MAYTDYLASLQQQRQPAGLDNGSAAAGMLMQALQRKQQYDAHQAQLALATEERKRLAAERERQLKAEERKAKETRLKATEDYVGRMAQAGLGDSAAAAYKQAQGLRTELYGLAGPDIVGSENPNAYDVQTHQPMRDFNNPTTLGMLQNLSGVKPDVGTLAPGNMAYNKATGAEIARAPFAPKVVTNGRYGNSIVDLNQGGAGLPAGMPAHTGGAPAPAARPGMIVPPAPVQPRSSGGGSRGGGRRRSGGGGRGGKPSAATASTGGATVKPGTVNSVLTTVDKMKTAVAERHTKGRNTDWAAVDKEWRPRAEAYLKRNGMNPDEYLPAQTKAAPAKPSAQAPAQQPQGNWLQRWFKSSDAPELTPQVAALLQEAGLFEDLG